MCPLFIASVTRCQQVLQVYLAVKGELPTYYDKRPTYALLGIQSKILHTKNLRHR